MDQVTIQRLRLGERIKSLRISKEMSRYALAKSAGIREPTVKSIEEAECIPRFDNIVRIAEALSTPLRDLF
ncbi:hypothetical protein MASR1M31_04620 [Porphyromonadaceae bacterium]